MSISRKTTADGIMQLSETVTLGNATTVYSSEITGLKPNANQNFWATLTAVLSASLAGTNIDVALYGADTATGTKFVLKDAIVADLTDTTLKAGQVDINAYPAAHYFLGFLSDADETAKTVTWRLTVPYPGEV